MGHFRHALFVRFPVELHGLDALDHGGGVFLKRGVPVVQRNDVLQLFVEHEVGLFHLFLLRLEVLQLVQMHLIGHVEPGNLA